MSDLPDVGREPEGLAPYQPNTAQAMAKSRLQQRLSLLAGVTDVASMPLDELAQAAGDRRVLQWLKDPAFAAWFLDKDEFVHRAAALKEVALRQLSDIIENADDKAKLKAIDMLLQLTGSYPGRRTAADALDDHLDRLVGKLTEAEVDSKLAALKARLGATKTT